MLFLPPQLPHEAILLELIVSHAKMEGRFVLFCIARHVDDADGLNRVATKLISRLINDRRDINLGITISFPYSMTGTIPFPRDINTH